MNTHTLIDQLRDWADALEREENKKSIIAGIREVATDIEREDQLAPLPTLLTYAQVAAFLNIPLGTLYSWIHHKKCPHYRFSNRMVRFDLQELRKWLEERKS